MGWRRLCLECRKGWWRRRDGCRLVRLGSQLHHQRTACVLALGVVDREQMHPWQPHPQHANMDEQRQRDRHPDGGNRHTPVVAARCAEPVAHRSPTERARYSRVGGGPRAEFGQGPARSAHPCGLLPAKNIHARSGRRPAQQLPAWLAEGRPGKLVRSSPAGKIHPPRRLPVALEDPENSYCTKLCERTPRLARRLQDDTAGPRRHMTASAVPETWRPNDEVHPAVGARRSGERVDRPSPAGHPVARR